MREIKCPNCNEVFETDESAYASIVKQVRDSEFDQQIQDRLELAAEDKQNAVDLAIAKHDIEKDKETATKNAKIKDLEAMLESTKAGQNLLVTESRIELEKERDALLARIEQAKADDRAASKLAAAQHTNEIQTLTMTKDEEIEKLKAQIQSTDVAQELAVREAKAGLEKERNTLAGELDRVIAEKQAESHLAEAEHLNKLQALANEKAEEIQRLKGQLESSKISQELAITEAVGPIEQQRDEFKISLAQERVEKELAEKSLKDKYETQIQDRDDMIDRLRDLKSKLSTKMVGETLEQHCETEFNRIRATAFPLAYFEKDNDSKGGGKGDYIFRDLDKGETEVVSIMFEMKNESDGTTSKKKNEDFLKELDKDRNEKGCEYAILVSLLEPNSELYNTDIVDVSYRYPKTYVIRPQFFIPIITILRDAALMYNSSEEDIFLKMSEALGLIGEDDQVARHPLSYLVEAADDICYQVLDLEDAASLGIYTPDKTKHIFWKVAGENEDEKWMGLPQMRGRAIYSVMKECWSIFESNYDSIMNREYVADLKSQIKGTTGDHLDEMAECYKVIFSDRKKVSTELAAYKILSGIFGPMAKAIKSIIGIQKGNGPNSYQGLPFVDRKCIELTWGQYYIEKNFEEPYEWWIASAMDFVAGLTDNHAVRLEQDFRGANISA